MSSSKENVSASRSAALSHLERVDLDNAYIERLEVEGLDDRSRRQARELVAGVTRQRRWLDFVLGEAYHGDYDSIEPQLCYILRLGLYELLFQSTPTRAVVHEYVELAKQTLRPGAGDLVNAVLRTIDRDREHIPTPDTGDEALDLSMRYSHPTWLVRRWINRYGSSETADLLEWNNRRPTYSIRVNLLRTSLEEVRSWFDENDVVYTESPHVQGMFRLRRLQALVKGDLLDKGFVAVQDESANLVVRLLNPQPGERVIDGCAAPGGKTMAVAEQMNGEGDILAIDSNQERLDLVEEAAERHHVEESLNTKAGELQSLVSEEEIAQADRVLLDVPCSGLGVLAKRADLRWRRSEPDLNDLTELQDDLLHSAADLVREGGLLVYSTCTIEPQENEKRIEAFLSRRTDFKRESAKAYVPEEVVSDAGALATLPHRHRMDGAYAVRLRRVT